MRFVGAVILALSIFTAIENAEAVHAKDAQIQTLIDGIHGGKTQPSQISYTSDRK